MWFIFMGEACLQGGVFLTRRLCPTSQLSGLRCPPLPSVDVTVLLFTPFQVSGTPCPLLGVVLCFSVSLAMIMPEPPGHPGFSPPPPPGSDDSYFPTDEDHLAAPSGGSFSLPGNMSRTSRFFDMGMEDGVMPNLGPDMSHCQMLLEAPEAPPLQTVPWFCLCAHCKGTAGSKGDRGSRGLSG